MKNYMRTITMENVHYVYFVCDMFQYKFNFEYF